MDTLNQSTSDTVLPTTIAQAFEHGLDLEQQVLAAQDTGADAGEVTDRKVAVEHLALTPSRCQCGGRMAADPDDHRRTYGAH